LNALRVGMVRASMDDPREDNTSECKHV
jgi:hypothetical protein